MTSKSTLVFGLGRSGLAVLRHLTRLKWPFEWTDDKPTERDRQAARVLGALECTRLEPARFAQVVAAPGVPIDHPFLTACKSAGIQVWGEAELCYRTVPTPLVGVTGTAGKTSTTALTAHLLAGQGLQALPGGNIGTPLLDVAPGIDVAVAELSSFQLERVDTFRPVVSVITNMGVDHLNRHGTVAVYHAAKWNLLRRQRAGDCAVLPASLQAPVPDGVQIYRVVPGGLEAGWLLDLDGQPVIPGEVIPGHQHPENAAAAVLATLAFLLAIKKRPDIAALHGSLGDFAGVNGRFQTVATVNGAAFVDDSIATRTISVEAALRSARAPVAWIVGGLDKGADLAPLRAAALGKVARVIAVGRDGPSLAARLAVAETTVIDEPDGWTAMRAACRVGLDAAPGGTVLLAPIGTSFDQFRDYRERGDAFAAAARELAGDKA